MPGRTHTHQSVRSKSYVELGFYVEVLRGKKNSVDLSISKSWVFAYPLPSIRLVHTVQSAQPDTLLYCGFLQSFLCDSKHSLAAKYVHKLTMFLFNPYFFYIFSPSILWRLHIKSAIIRLTMHTSRHWWSMWRTKNGIYSRIAGLSISISVYVSLSLSRCPLIWIFGLEWNGFTGNIFWAFAIYLYVGSSVE